MDMDGHTTGTDYSDFEHQYIQSQVAFEGAGNLVGTNQNMEAKLDYEPLEAGGGLDQNEVAELVYFRLSYGIEIEDESADQDVATTGEMRGTFGANLPKSRNAFVNVGQEKSGDVIGAFNGVNEDQVRVVGEVTTDDRIFTHFKQTSGWPADDQTNGPGSNGATGFRSHEKNYRDVLGRGPVLDSNDDLSFAIGINASDNVLNFIGEVRAQLYWDVAEVDDAGRAFSVPE